MPRNRALRRPHRRSRLAALPLTILLLAFPAAADASDRVLEFFVPPGGDQICANGFPCDLYFEGISDDGSHVFLQTGATFVPEDTDAGDDIYDRHDGRSTLITPGGSERGQVFFEGSSRDGRHVFFTSPHRLVPQDADSATDLYESQAGSIRLISIGPAGGNAEQHVLFGGNSADGSRVYFTTRESLVTGDTDDIVDLYVRAGEKVERVAPGAPIRPNLEPRAYFAGSSPNSSHDFFVTDKQVLPEDLDDCLDIYQWVEGNTSLVVPDDGRPGHCFDENLLGVTRDASHVFYEKGVGTIYVRTCFGHEATLYAPEGPPYSSGTLAGFSEDGRIAYFVTDRALTSDDRDFQTDVYRWENGTVTRVSTGPVGGNRDDSDGVPTVIGVSWDGSRVFFMTREALTANDQPAVDSYGQPNYDIYVHGSGTTTLVTTGTGPHDQQGQAAGRVSRDGHRVIFRALEDSSTWEWLDGALTRMIGPNGQPWHPSALLGQSRDLVHYFFRGSDSTEIYNWRLRGPMPQPISVPPSGCPGSAHAPSQRRGVRLSRLRVRPRAFHAGHRRPSLGKRRGRAAVVSFRLSSRARVRLVFGKRALVRCRGRTGRKRCVRHRRSGTLTIRGIAGRNRIYFDGVVRRGRALRPGRYRLAARPLAAGAKTKRARFRMLRARR